jgi:ABC-type nitrate/sulfonate/bicarbonate transport system permease component
VAAAAGLSVAHGRQPGPAGPVGTAGPRLLAAVVLLGGWQALASSGLLFRDVVPPLQALAAGLWAVARDGGFWADARVTGGELLGAVLVGGVAGGATGLLLGSSPLLSAAFERWITWFGPTPKIILFPVLILLCGVGPGSKVAMGAVSCFFPMVLSTAAAVRGVDPVLLRVARSFRARRHQTLMKVYLPATVAPLLNGVRLGFGLALIGVLLAETKLSNQGVGFAVMQAYARFDMPRMYGLLILVVGFAAAVNIVLGHGARRAAGATGQEH